MTTSMSVTIDEDVQRRASSLFAELGLDMDTAIGIFLRRALRDRAIPFAVELRTERREVSDEAFFSGADLRHLRRSVAQAEAGRIHQRDLICADDDIVDR